MEDVFSDIGHHRKRKPVRYPGNNRLGAKIRVLKRENGWEMGGFEPQLSSLFPSSSFLLYLLSFSFMNLFNEAI